MQLYWKSLIIAAAVLAAVSAAGAVEVNTTKGECSPIVTSNQEAVTIECRGMSEQLQKQIIAILNSILQKQLDPAVVMAKLNEISSGMGELKSKSQDAARGIIDIYDFNGAHRIQSAGRTQVIVGEQVAAFKKIVELEKNGQWQQLLDLCEQQIAAAPEWLTAYLCAGEAYANMGDRSDALKRLEFVVQNAGNDPNYRSAAIMLERLKARK